MRVGDSDGAAAAGPTGTASSREAGFTLIGLIVAIAVINIGLAVAVTSWSHLGKRAKEAELIWRGQQYVRALRCHQTENGALPDDLDELLESDCIRALYPEPMNPDGQWRLIRQSDMQLAAQSAGGFAGNRSAADVLDNIDRELQGPEAYFGGRGGQGRGGTQGDSLQAAYQRLQTLNQRLAQNFSTSGDGIVGVASYSTEEALRLYEGETTYDAWRFVAQ